MECKYINRKMRNGKLYTSNWRMIELNNWRSIDLNLRPKDKEMLGN